MSRTQLQFFATREDLEPVIREIESAHRLRYVLSQLGPISEAQTYETALELPNLGTASTGDAVHEPSYLVIDRSDDIYVRPIKQRRGGTLYATYPHPRSILFRPGGRYDAAHLIHGEIVTGSADEKALVIYSLFEKAIKSAFKNIKGCRVGVNALSALDSGTHLTRAVGVPAEYDLKR
jgi:hypothetical protein